MQLKQLMWPVPHVRISPVDNATKVGVQVPVKVNFFFKLSVYDLIKN